jgi:uncharacterized protein (TIGR02246 family)
MDDEQAVEQLYQALLAAWNACDANAWGDLFAADGSLVGFDGSPVETRASMVEHLAGVFGDHQPARYVGKTREVRLLGTGAALLRGVAGMVPPGSSEPEPRLNTIQTVVAVRGTDGWRVAHFQSTPAAFDGRPEAVEQLTAELRAEVSRAD